MKILHCSKCQTDIDIDLPEIETDGNIFKCSNCLTWQEVPKINNVVIQKETSRVAILNNLTAICSQEELFSLAGVLDKKASFIAALDNKNWGLAQYKIVESFNEGLITEIMRDKILSLIPTV